MRIRWAVGLCALAAGCGREATAPAGTGAREAAQGYYEALVRQDWPRAYDALHPQSRGRLRPEQFAALAADHRRGVGFEPSAVHVRSCEEQGDEATAHVVLTGTNVTKERHRDAVRLLRDGDGWGVVLPPTFGRPAR
jgi:hypothetical protein